MMEVLLHAAAQVPALVVLCLLVYMFIGSLKAERTAIETIASEALHRLGLFECVLPGPEWHLPMVRQSVQLEELVSRAFAERQGLIATLAEAFPQARLLHFWARLKLSRKVLDSAHQLDRATLDT